MTEKLPEPNMDPLRDEELSEDELKKKYPCLSVAPKKDWPGILKRAEREGVPVDRLKLREFRPPSGFAIPEFDRDVPGILDRVVREGKPIQQLNLRGSDSIHDIYKSMYFMLAKAGFPVRDYFEEGDGPVTKRFFRSILPPEDVEKEE